MSSCGNSSPGDDSVPPLPAKIYSPSKRSLRDFFEIDEDEQDGDDEDEDEDDEELHKKDNDRDGDDDDDDEGSPAMKRQKTEEQVHGQAQKDEDQQVKSDDEVAVEQHIPRSSSLKRLIAALTPTLLNLSITFSRHVPVMRIS